MNLHEFQGKSILRKYGVSVPEGIVAYNAQEAVEAARTLKERTGTEKWAVKAQIHAGGRGKGGGVKIAKTLEEVELYASQIIGMMLRTPQTPPEGKLVKKVLIEQNIYYPGPRACIGILYERVAQPSERPQHDYVFSQRRNGHRSGG